MQTKRTSAATNFGIAGAGGPNPHTHTGGFAPAPRRRPTVRPPIPSGIDVAPLQLALKYHIHMTR